MEKWQKREIIAREYEETGIYNAVTLTDATCYDAHVLLNAVIAARGIANHVMKEQVCVHNGYGTFWWTRKWTPKKVWWHLDNKMRFDVVLELTMATGLEVAQWGGQTGRARHYYINLSNGRFGHDLLEVMA